MNTQREMFETWQLDSGRTDPMYLVYSEKDNRYALNNVQSDWDSWQAAIAAQEDNKLSWQPIKTAPKDGTRIIIFSERRGAREARFYRENEEGAEWFDVIVGGGPVTHFYDATHWMPLPQEPNK